ncbi:hypothetical protein GCM10009575_097450 [Streptomyces rhizosphaericus]|uniref:Uncharacterized protein n=1 Tax=Streptomyces rhizosphaericus TaxID=114699 RepID=A0ABN1RRV1_9ACTN
MDTAEDTAQRVQSLGQSLAPAGECLRGAAADAHWLGAAEILRQFQIRGLACPAPVLRTIRRDLSGTGPGREMKAHGGAVVESQMHVPHAGDFATAGSCRRAIAQIPWARG